CVPARPMSVAGSTIYSGAPSPGDRDGDGVPDATDNCPTVFNPVRPVDGGKQADADGDGLGDACDPCPLDASNQCPARAFDRDGDGVPDTRDNCINVANPTQADRDGDGKGDACDACPDQANPGLAPCAVTIYQIKQRQLPLGQPVALAGALVTGVGASGFFVQVKPGDPGYQSDAFSGLFVLSPGT